MALVPFSVIDNMQLIARSFKALVGHDPIIPIRLNAMRTHYTREL